MSHNLQGYFTDSKKKPRTVKLKAQYLFLTVFLIPPCYVIYANLPQINYSALYKSTFLFSIRSLLKPVQSDEQEKVAKHSGSCWSVVLFSVLLHNPLPSSDIPLEAVSHHTCFCSTKHFSSLKVLKSKFLQATVSVFQHSHFFFLRSTHSSFKQLERI